jgi:hypothetical protein
MEKLGGVSSVMKIFKKFDRNGDGQVNLKNKDTGRPRFCRYFFKTILKSLLSPLLNTGLYLVFRYSI